MRHPDVGHSRAAVENTVYKRSEVVAAAYREEPAFSRQNSRFGYAYRIGIEGLARDKQFSFCPEKFYAVAVHVGYFYLDTVGVVHHNPEFQRLVGESVLGPLDEFGDYL